MTGVAKTIIEEPCVVQKVNFSKYRVSCPDKGKRHPGSLKSIPGMPKEGTLLAAATVLLAGHRLAGGHPVLRIVVNPCPTSSVITLANMNLPMLRHFRIVSDILDIHFATSFQLLSILVRKSVFTGTMIVQ